jgi:hypothetical protein
MVEMDQKILEEMDYLVDLVGEEVVAIQDIPQGLDNQELVILEELMVAILLQTGGAMMGEQDIPEQTLQAAVAAALVVMVVLLQELLEVQVALV